MDKRYQVFVSSTYEDLQEERKEVMQALLELDCIPAGMELFPASNDDQWTLIKKVIDDCDYYLLIIGGRYGSTNETGKSYTQMEFEYALSINKPIISFLPKHPENIPAGKTEQDAKKKENLEGFKQIVQSKMVKYWETPENLGSVVSRSMVRLIKDFPAEGWVKSGSVVDEKSIQEIARLQREKEELEKKLANIATEPPRGTEEFAQGEDKVKIEYSFEGIEGEDFPFPQYYDENSIIFNWNQLFACIAPSMIEGCIIYTLQKNLEALIAENANWQRMKMFSNLDRVENVKISKSSLDLVIIQFRALGMIELSDKKRSASDHNTYWRLTPYGDYVMNRLLAVKKHN